MVRTDVTILGGGPVGSLLGILLRDMGLEVVIVERDATPYMLPRAIVMDDEVQRILVDHGMGPWLKKNTSRLQRADFVGLDDQEFIGADIPPTGPQGVPPVVVHYQPELDAMLRAELLDRGATLRYGRTVTDLTDHPDRVATVLDDGEEIESRWFVGCDGASSWTRKKSGLTLEDLQFDQEWIVVDIDLNEDSPAQLPVGVRQYCLSHRPCTYVQGHNRNRRWEFQVQPGEDTQSLDTTEGLWSLLSPWVAPKDATLVRSAVYRFHAVVAPRMHIGNVYLAGDSAHQTPPFAGQGLNSGMRDALNLAWKMCLVHRGLAHQNLLDQYSTERVPHVRSSVAHAVDMGRLIDQLAGRTSHGVGLDSGYGGTRPAPHIEAGVVYGDHPRVGHLSKFHPATSAAAIANGASFTVVTSDRRELPEAYQSFFNNVDASELLDDAYAIVLRPDRYIAAVAKNQNELQQALRHISTCLADSN